MNDAEHLVARRDVAQARAGSRCSLSAGGRSSGCFEPDACGNGFVDQRVERRRADRLRASRRARRRRGPMWRERNVSSWRRASCGSRYFTSSSYCAASSSAPASAGLVSLTTIIQLPCGSVLTASGLSLSAALTSTTSPDDRRVELGHGLHRLDRAERLPLLQLARRPPAARRRRRRRAAAARSR